MDNLTLDLETLVVESFGMNAEAESLGLVAEHTDRFPDCTFCCALP